MAGAAPHGAVSVGQSAWLAPSAPAFADGIARAVQLVHAAGGEAIVLDASGRQPADSERLAVVYTAAREAEWVEFVAECGKYLAELDEEEHSLERLRRWHRELRLRDVLGAPSAADADQRLKAREAKLEDSTQRVFHAVGGQWSREPDRATGVGLCWFRPATGQRLTPASTR